MQELGLEMLLFADDAKRSEQDLEEFKRALVASGNYDVDKLYFEEEKSDEDFNFDDPSAIYDFSDVGWETPDEGEFEEFEQLQKELDNDSVILTEQTPVYGEWI